MSEHDAADQEYEYCTISLSLDDQRRLARQEMWQFVLRTLVTLCVSAATTIGLLMIYSAFIGGVGI